VDDSDIVLPRPTVVLLRQRTSDLVALLLHYREAGVGSDDETIAVSMDACEAYLSEILRILALIERANDYKKR